MADEALMELVELLRNDGWERAEERWVRLPNKMRGYASALESALSELARLRAEREWKPIAELAELKPALVGLEGEYPTMAWRTKDGRWAVSEFDALQWTPTHYMTLPDEPQSHEEKQE